ncbi:MAG TPA: DUF4097 family beta strand repeat-containing protein [Ktedonobacteraceae bacterium]|nr:DUF4097 family beta strand repeat-containing protein [Ktedonobacteraceae bacterium]
MNHQESSFMEPERRVYEARNINTDPREQRQQYQSENPQMYGGSGQQQQMGEKPRTSRERRPRRGWIFLLVVLLLIVLVAGGVVSLASSFVSSLSSTGTHSFSGIAHPKLVIQDDSGTIHVHTGGSGDAVTVSETKFVRGIGPLSLDGMHVDYTKNGNTISIVAQSGNGALFFGSRDIDLDITVPTVSDLSIHNGSGQVEVDDINGSVVAKTGSGSINASNLNGPVTLETGSGSINASGINGQAIITTGSGSIEVTDAKLSGQSVVKTDSGPIKFSGSIDPAGSYQFETGSGSIDATLPTSSAFKLNASTGSGDVTNDFGSTAVGNDPRAALRMQTGSGSISLHKGQ